MDSKRRTEKAPAGAPGEISEREYWQQEKEKAIWDLMIFFAAVVIVAIAVGTAAWFASNREVSGNNMMVTTEVPEYVQISIGRTSDVVLNDTDDYLVLSGQAVQTPRETETDSSYDWSNRVNISNYYRFGRLIPASSDSGRHILFTPDAAGTGKNLKKQPRFFRADGESDGDIKTVQGIAQNVADTDSLMATAHAYGSAAEKQQESFWNGYTRSTSWYNTNDDGYYTDIPIWLRTNAESDISLSVEGYVTKKNGTLQTGENSDALYKAVRVALLKEQDSEWIPVVLADETGKAKNIIPIQDADDYGHSDQSILDTENYTVTRDTEGSITDNKLFGIQLLNASSIRQAANYVEYLPYNGESVVTLAAPSESEADGWGEAVKLMIRIWLDGDDKDCWNATAGQDWSIHLKFAKIESEP